MAKLVHSMIRVIDEAASTAFYQTAFGLEVADRIAFDDFALVYLRHPSESSFELELTVNFGRAEPYELGNGYGHLAVVVDDLNAEHARFTAAGLNPRPLKELPNNGTRLARYFFVTDPDGYLVEVIEKAGRFA